MFYLTFPSSQATEVASDAETEMIELSIDYWTRKKDAATSKEEQSTQKASFSRVSVTRFQRPLIAPSLSLQPAPSSQTMPSSSSANSIPPTPAPTQATPHTYLPFFMSMTYNKDKKQLVRLPTKRSAVPASDKFHSKTVTVTKMICSTTDPSGVVQVAVDSIELSGVKFVKLLPFWRSHIQNFPVARFEEGVGRGDVV